ncbi:MAG: 3-ketoacyl-CoA thiolase [Candidatus Riflebacteria bacterium]|nr:3-ketoacyl-CoA thiolase [Candidatus Riflebacteria bacterium]
MKKLRKNVYMVCGFNTISLGTGRKEFHPKKPRPGLEQYIQEAGKGVIAQIPSASLVDECVISNFMAARFCRQGNLAALMPTIDPSLEFKPSTRVEGACGSGGLALYTGVKSVLAETADVVLALGVEVQNTVKAIYGADYLALAGHYATERKSGHAYFFPAKFSDRAGAYAQKYGRDRTRQAMAHWYVQAIEHARKCPKAQEHHNETKDLLAAGMTTPNPAAFVEELNFFDCSKVSDGASAILICSEEGLVRLGIPKEKAVLVRGIGQAQADLTKGPRDLTELTTSKEAVRKAVEMAGVAVKHLGVLEVHDCFTITGLLALEAIGVVPPGEAIDYVIAGKTRIGSELPTNCTGGLIGFGHPTGASGVRMAVDLWSQLTRQAGDCQANLAADRSLGLMVSMGGNDKTTSAVVVQQAS